MSKEEDVKKEEKEKLLSGQDGGTYPLLFSCRFHLSILQFVGFLLAYALRTNMSVAIVCMLNHTALTPEEQNPNTTSLQKEQIYCRRNPQTGSTVTQDGEFVWSKNIQGMILGAFFWGYLVTQIPGGWMATRFGGKRVCGYCMLVCSIVTLLSPEAARIDYRFLVILRVVAGLSQGMMWPAMHAMWAKWAPPLERSKLGGFGFAGAQLGNFVIFSTAGVLCAYGFDGGWPSIFYIFGIAGVIWFFAWMLLVADSPEEHTRITKEEKTYIINSTRGTVTDMNVGVIKWKELLTSPRVWAIVVSLTCEHWGTYTFLTNIPTYMDEVLKLDITQNGLLSAIPYFFYWLFIIICGYIADYLRSRRLLNTTNTRKLFAILGLVIPAIAIICTGYVNCHNANLAVALLTIGIGFYGCVYQGPFINPGDIAPRYAGIIYGLANSIGTVPGILAPLAISVITVDQTQAQWKTVFFICAGISLLGCAIYLVFGTGELQEWARDDENYEIIVSPDYSPKENKSSDYFIDRIMVKEKQIDMGIDCDLKTPRYAKM